MGSKITKMCIILIAVLFALFACSNPVENAGISSDEAAVAGESSADRTIYSVHRVGAGLRVMGSKRFPQHIASWGQYGLARPKGLSNNYMDNEVKKYYDKWKKDYFYCAIPHKAGCMNKEYAYVKQSGKETINGKEIKFKTTSEAMGYGMIIMAIMAGYETKAQKYFDALYRTVRHCPSKMDGKINYNLTSWIGFGSKLGNGKVLSDNAPDGDMDIAFALLMAYRQWDNKYYLYQAHKRMKAIYDSNINYKNTNYPRINLGDWGNDPGEKKWYNALRSSDWMPSHFKAFSKYDSAYQRRCMWKKLLDRTDNLIDTIQSPEGLVPDFATGTSSLVPVGSNFMEDQYDGCYNYNACRYPLRMACYISQYAPGKWYRPWGSSTFVYSETPYEKQLKKLLRWAMDECLGWPQNFKEGYSLSGGPIEKGPSPAFVGPITAAAIVCGSEESLKGKCPSFLKRGFLYLKDNFKKPNGEEGYYESTLGLLSMFVINGNWWGP